MPLPASTVSLGGGPQFERGIAMAHASLSVAGVAMVEAGAGPTAVSVARRKIVPAVGEFSGVREQFRAQRES